MGLSNGDQLVVVANRLPAEFDAELGWRTSPGGLVSALEPALRGRSALWVGWGGRLAEGTDSDEGNDPADAGGVPSDAGFELDEIKLSAAEVAGY